MQCEKWNEPAVSSRAMTLTAGRSRSLLEPEAVERIVSYVMTQYSDSGGFKGRSDADDLYYTLFGLECLQALEQPLPLRSTAPYLQQFKRDESLDFVHRACLVRCLAKLNGNGSGTDMDARQSEQALCDALEDLETHRSGDGGYRLTPEAGHDSVYAAFLALLAHEDAGIAIREPRRLVRSIRALRSGDGAYADRPGLPGGTTTVTAAAAVLLSRLGEPVSPDAADWLMARFSRHGGFLATAHAPVPDLLSTATALFALYTLKYPLDAVRESCMTFIAQLWDESGGFCGHVFDSEPDCEYTFYGLLSLGILTAVGGLDS